MLLVTGVTPEPVKLVPFYDYMYKFIDAINMI